MEPLCTSSRTSTLEALWAHYADQIKREVKGLWRQGCVPLMGGTMKPL